MPVTHDISINGVGYHFIMIRRNPEYWLQFLVPNFKRARLERKLFQSLSQNTQTKKYYVPSKHYVLNKNVSCEVQKYELKLL